MMRVVGRIFVVAAVTSLVAASVVSADPVRLLDTSAEAYFSPSDGSGPRAFMGTGFDSSEGYPLGTCSNVLGWRSFGANNAPPSFPRPGFFSNNFNQPANAPSSGNTGGGDQSLLLQQNTSALNGTNVGCLSPKFMDPTQGTLNTDVLIDDIGGSNYYINPQAPSQGFTTARIVFSYGGNILVLDDLDGPGAGGLTFEDTGVVFGLGVWGTLQVVLDVPNARIKYWYGPDKANLVQIYDGYMFGGSLFEEQVVFSDNYQNTGSGYAIGPVTGAYIDNILLKPEPATLALLGIGTLLVVRRRK